MNILFHGSASDVYVHWLIFSLGLGVLVSGVAVITSCRVFAATFVHSGSEDSMCMKIYRSYYKYHSSYWNIFWIVIVLHLMVTIYHLRFPVAGEPFLYAHKIAIFTALANIFFIEYSAGYPSACWREESGSPEGEAKALAWGVLFPV